MRKALTKNVQLFIKEHEHIKFLIISFLLSVYLEVYNNTKHGCLLFFFLFLFLCSRYFCYPFEDSNIELDEQMMDDPDKAKFLMAHNGWVTGGDVLKGFMYEDSHVMLCRELFAWGDSIKLRYGDSPNDVPFLWEYMKTYTELMAR